MGSKETFPGNYPYTGRRGAVGALLQFWDVAGVPAADCCVSEVMEAFEG